MRRASSVAAALLFLASALPAHAADSPGRRRLVVRDLVAKGLDQDKADFLTTAIVGDLEATNAYRIYTRAEIQSVLEQIGQAQKLGKECDTTQCMLDFGAAMGADRVIAGEVQRMGSRFQVRLTLYNIHAGDRENQVTKQCACSEDELIDKVPLWARELMGSAAGVPVAGATAGIAGSGASRSATRAMPRGPAAGPPYTGTLYASGHGGHLAVAEVRIDPSQPQPVSVRSLDLISIGTSKTHPFHDIGIDPWDRGTLYYATYKLDPDKRLHVGRVDLVAGRVTADQTVGVDQRARWTGANYKSSGQTPNSYVVASMAYEGYIDVFDKRDLSLRHRVFLDSLIGRSGYQFLFGTAAPDGRTFYVVANEATGDPTEGWATTGTMKVFLLDLPELEEGRVREIRRSRVSGGNQKSTIAFQPAYTDDGGRVLQPANDLLFVIDPASVRVEWRESRLAGMVHDAVTTPDGKYALVALRKKGQWEGASEPVMDGHVQLYDMDRRAPVGESVSLCHACHRSQGIGKDAILGGLEANWR